jgi:hypothetical protein
MNTEKNLLETIQRGGKVNDKHVYLILIEFCSFQRLERVGQVDIERMEMGTNAGRIACAKERRRRKREKTTKRLK